MRNVFLDKLSVSSLSSLVLRGYIRERIFFFELSALGKILARLLKAVRIISVKPEQIDFTLAGLTDKHGECKYFEVTDDIRRLTFEFCDNEIKNNEFFRRFSSIVDADSMLIFLSKSITEAICNSVVYFHVAKRHISQLENVDSSVIFLIERNFWSRRLCGFFSTVEFEAADYFAGISNFIFNLRGILQKQSFIKLSVYLNSFLSRVFFFKKFIKKARVNHKARNIDCNDKQPCLSAWYSGNTLTFDLDKRSAFFWLLKSDLPSERILFYFSRSDVPILNRDAIALKENGIKCVALNAGARESDVIPMWLPGEKYKYMSFKLIKKMFGVLIRTARSGKLPSFFLISKSIGFLLQYAYWLDFFEAHKVKIGCNADDFLQSSIPRNLALKDCGGVSISYQYANLWVSSATLSYYSDILFTFGPAYNNFWKETRSRVKQLIFNGYPTDYSFSETRDRSLELRRELESQGVKFIICFLDENSSDNKLAMISNEDSARTYKFFLEKVLEDSTLGLICKPGYPLTLRNRIGSISGLLDTAVASRRCVLLDSGAYLTEKYPSEAAQAADVTVALLLGGAAGMESSLTNTPTVFLDEIGLYSHPLYRIGKGSLVFDNIDDLYSGIEKFRKSADAIPGFGDLSLWLRDRVAFRDGLGAQRMGNYMFWLLEEFAAGKSREEAISIANKRFTTRWGAENIEHL